jgi:hypothetical protein
MRVAWGTAESNRVRDVPSCAMSRRWRFVPHRRCCGARAARPCDRVNEVPRRYKITIGPRDGRATRRWSTRTELPQYRTRRWGLGAVGVSRPTRWSRARTPSTSCRRRSRPLSRCSSRCLGRENGALGPDVIRPISVLSISGPISQSLARVRSAPGQRTDLDGFSLVNQGVGRGKHHSVRPLHFPW